MSKIKKCPHCESSAGYQYFEVLKTSRFGYWGESCEKQESIYISSTIPKCISCFKRVRNPLEDNEEICQ